MRSCDQGLWECGIAHTKNGLVFLLALFGTVGLSLTAQGQTQEQTSPPLPLSLPLECAIGTTCFLQNLVDLDEGPGVIDAFSQSASYDGHKGIDIRVIDISDMDEGVEILAVADGIVTGNRDGMEDVLVEGSDTPATIAGRECGNGVIIRHADGWTSQYCHLRRGSVAVERGDRVRRGEVIGTMGLSGLTAFPHIHLTIRHNDTIIDPLTGKEVALPASTAAPDLSGSLFGAEIADKLSQSRNVILDVGLSNAVFSLRELVEGDVPPPPTSQAPLAIGWAWVINMNAGDQIAIDITANGQPFASTVSEKLSRHQAQYFHFAGRNRSPEPGEYILNVKVLRDGAVIRERTSMYTVEP